MDLPTPRELELETLLRQRDAQLADLTVRSTIACARVSVQGDLTRLAPACLAGRGHALETVPC